MLEGGDRASGVGEGGLEMSEDLRRRPVRRFGRQFGRRAACRQYGADLALAVVKAFPDALPGTVTATAVGGAAGRADAADDGGFEETPQRTGCQAQASDFVRHPDAEGPPATAACVAVAAEDPPGADRSLRTDVVITVQRAVPNQRTDNLAVRTGRLLEPLGKQEPFLGAAVKPLLFAHSCPAKIVILRRATVAG